jgi:hypothetical protein
MTSKVMVKDNTIFFTVVVTCVMTKPAGPVDTAVNRI